ncbi:MAG: sigma-54 dependent transcriptional regulator [Oligoflexia bacterium]|nr:sigma-54 dependent transcriptional regulator [Oligoflexia bacterium]
MSEFQGSPFAPNTSSNTNAVPAAIPSPRPQGSHNVQMIYKSDIVSQLVKMIERVAPSQATVLILGQSGTGKELIARLIHEKSNRKNKPFVAINCGALRETLLESELFGHEKGSFTGAYTRKIGLAEIANGGTLFLDEIGELTQGIQSKLLRFLQEGEIYRVGGKDPIRVDIRLVSATNRDLESEVVKQNFREDLFYRINTITVNTPALSKRKEDIPVLVEHFLSQGKHGYLGRGRQMSPEAMAVLMNYPWPGNIRELQNVCERMQILAEGHMIMVGDLPDNIRRPTEKVSVAEYDPDTTLYEVEKRHILKALHYFNGNKTRAAHSLGITIKTLYNKLHMYGEFENFSVHSKPEPVVTEESKVSATVGVSKSDSPVV